MTAFQHLMSIFVSMPIKRYLYLLIAFLAFSCSGFSQDSLRIYFNENGTRTKPETAYFFRDLLRSKADPELYVGGDYYMSGLIKATAGYLLHDGFFHLNGKFVEYAESGIKIAEGTYVADTTFNFSKKTGRWKYYDNNGALRKECIYKPDPKSYVTQELVFNFWDSTGQQLVAKGEGYYYYTVPVTVNDKVVRIAFKGEVRNGYMEGQWNGTLGNGQTLLSRYYKQGEIIAETIFKKDGVTMAYDSLNRPCLPPGDQAELQEILFRVIKYPKFDRDNNIQGTVAVEFTVNEDGSTTDYKVTQSVSPGIDAEALRAVKCVSYFRPKLVNGVAVKDSYTVRLTFKLT